MNTNTIKGFKDFLGDEALKRREIKRIVEKKFEAYGFEPVETPIIESEEFVRGKNTNDDAVRDIFKLEDRGERKLGLRYEFTFQLKRIAKNQKLPFKRYQIGEVFRDEPIREGRLRQFIQMDADVIGSSIKEEAEILSMAKEILTSLGIKPKIYINSRKLLNEILVSEGLDEKNQESVIRELDKLDKLSQKEVADNLKKFNAEKILKIFTQDESSFKDYKFYSEIKELKDLCNSYGVEVIFRPFLARGLGYYNGNVFEIWADELNVSVCGGGSYLVDQVQSTGITFGLEPIMILSNVEGKKTKVQVISVGKDNESIKLVKELREEAISVNLIMNKTVAKALEYANSKGIEFVIILGEEEIKSKKFKLKNMKTGKEELLSEKDLIKKLT